MCVMRVMVLAVLVVMVVVIRLAGSFTLISGDTYRCKVRRRGQRLSTEVRGA